MHRKIILKIMPIFTFLFLISLLCPIVSSDGGLFVYTVDYWIEAPEENQIGIINYEDGVESLTIVVDVKNSSLQSDQAFWIFPIPADPKTISIDVTNNIPFLRGKDVRTVASNNLENSFAFTLLTQFYTFPFFYYMLGSSLGTSGIENVQIYDHLEKMGLTTEIIGVNSSEALSVYLNEKNVNLTNDVDSILEEYIGENYSFVVTWISDVEQFKDNALIKESYRYYQYGEPFLMIGVKINFQTEKIYYPLKLTSIYGEKQIPILLQIHGFVTPTSEFNNMRTSYDIDGNIEYTEITIWEKANDLKQDLWVENIAPSITYLAGFIAANGLLFSLIIFILSSCISTLLAGIIIYYEQKPIIYRFLLFGLFNFLTLIGFGILTHVLNISKKFVKDPDEKISVKKKLDAIALRTVISFTIALAIMIAIIEIIYPLSAVSTLFLILICISVFAILSILVYLFAKDKKRIAFIILFSIFFLTINFSLYMYLESLF